LKSAKLIFLKRRPYFWLSLKEKLSAELTDEVEKPADYENSA